MMNSITDIKNVLLKAQAWESAAALVREIQDELPPDATVLVNIATGRCQDFNIELPRDSALTMLRSIASTLRADLMLCGIYLQDPSL